MEITKKNVTTFFDFFMKLFLWMRAMILISKSITRSIDFSTHFEMIRYFECSENVRSSSEIIFSDWDIKSKIDEAVFTDGYMTNLEF